MAERHAILHSRALSTLRNKESRSSVFKDGYGDFSFLPRHKPLVCWDCSEPVLLDRDSETSKGARPPSLNNNSYTPESNVVGFLTLPKEIRDQIYAHCVLPFRNPLLGGSVGSIRVKVGNVHGYPCHPFRDGYDSWVPPSIMLTDEDEDGSQIPECDSHVTYADYDRVRALSQVSRVVRSELGACFWSRTYVDINHWEYLFLDFLNDRPAIWSGIKTLRMQWECEGRPTALNRGWGAIIDFCNAVEHRLELDNCVLVLVTSYNVANKIIEKGENIAWVRALKKIKMKELTVNLSLVPHRNKEEDEDDDEEGEELDDEVDSDSLDDLYSDDDNDSLQSLEFSTANESDSAVPNIVIQPPFTYEDDSDSSLSSLSSISSELVQTPRHRLDELEARKERREMLQRRLELRLELILGPPLSIMQPLEGMCHIP
ncbi:hypothetical protein PVAG01_02714 [Phlyctema vagabunda]|uniref:F-box domain-containing protein n=1 Tax=Phlyctema vagabunda TaxID=108571 RepID=A0ABR4PRF5_9HELO